MQNKQDSGQHSGQSGATPKQSNQPTDPQKIAGSEKIQGEGDYESAKRFNESEREFVKQHGIPRQPNIEADEERKLENAEEQGKSRSRGREHDAVDEGIFRKGIDANDDDRKKH